MGTSLGFVFATPAKRTAPSGETLGWPKQVPSRFLLIPRGFRDCMLSAAGVIAAEVKRGNLRRLGPKQRKP